MVLLLLAWARPAPPLASGAGLRASLPDVSHCGRSLAGSRAQTRRGRGAAAAGEAAGQQLSWQALLRRWERRRPRQTTRPSSTPCPIPWAACSLSRRGGSSPRRRVPLLLLPRSGHLAPCQSARLRQQAAALRGPPPPRARLGRSAAAQGAAALGTAAALAAAWGAPARAARGQTLPRRPTVAAAAWGAGRPRATSVRPRSSHQRCRSRRLRAAGRGVSPTSPLHRNCVLDEPLA